VLRIKPDHRAANALVTVAVLEDEKRSTAVLRGVPLDTRVLKVATF